MPVSHARVAALTSTDEKVPGLLGVLAQVRDPRKMRGRRFSLVFALAVAVSLRAGRGEELPGDRGPGC